MEIVKRRTVKTLVTKLTSCEESDDQSRVESMCELRLLTKNDADSRPLVVEADPNAVHSIAACLYSPVRILQENAAATLLNISISCKQEIMSSQGVLDALSHALRRPASPSSAQCAAATVYSLLRCDSYRPIIGEKMGIVSALVEIVRNPRSPSRTIGDALMALFGIALYPLNRARMVELGTVEVLFSLISRDGRGGLVEDATAVIAQLAGCEESWAEFKKTSNLGVLLDMLDDATGYTCRTKENVVYALYNLVQFVGEMVVIHLRGEMEPRVMDGIQQVVRNGSEKGKDKAMAVWKSINNELRI